MSLRAQVESDLSFMMEDTSAFGWAIKVTNPEGDSADLAGLSTDIGTTIDPETGVAVAGRQASVALRISSLVATGLGVPRNVSGRDSRPWVVEFADIGGAPHVFKVSHAMPDTAIGVVTCMLEAYEK